MHRKQLNKNMRGFSLVEMIVVISVMAILSAASLPAIRSITQPTSVFAEAQQLLQSIQEARQLALTYNTPTRVAFFQDASQPGGPVRTYALLRLVYGDTAELNRWIQHSRRNQINDQVAFATDSPLLQLTRSNDLIYLSAENDSSNLPSSDYAHIEFLPTGEASGVASDLVFALKPMQDSSNSGMTSPRSVIVSVAPTTGRTFLLRSR